MDFLSKKYSCTQGYGDQHLSSFYDKHNNFETKWYKIKRSVKGPQAVILFYLVSKYIGCYLCTHINSLDSLVGFCAVTIVSWACVAEMVFSMTVAAKSSGQVTKQAISIDCSYNMKLKNRYMSKQTNLYVTLSTCNCRVDNLYVTPSTCNCRMDNLYVTPSTCNGTVDNLYVTPSTCNCRVDNLYSTPSTCNYRVDN